MSFPLLCSTAADNDDARDAHNIKRVISFKCVWRRFRCLSAVSVAATTGQSTQKLMVRVVSLQFFVPSGEAGRQKPFCQPPGQGAAASSAMFSFKNIDILKYFINIGLLIILIAVEYINLVLHRISIISPDVVQIGQWNNIHFQNGFRVSRHF